MTDSHFARKNTEVIRFPVLLCAPHAGRDYPAEILENCRLPAASLLRLEDRYSDLLMRAAQNAGFATITAQRARAWIDLNRADNDIDSAMIQGAPRHLNYASSAKQRGGLGLIPRRLHPAGEIWKRPITHADAQSRIAQYHAPYHQAVADILDELSVTFGGAVLLDIHSMPPVTRYSGDWRPDFVIGDRFGGSASSRLSGMLQAQIEAAGHICALNHPYAGDYILRRHGDPARNIHAIQLETCRSLYLDNALREPGGGLQQIQRLIANIAHMLSDTIASDDMIEAAE